MRRAFKTRLDGVRGIPPISQRTRNGWGTEVFFNTGALRFLCAFVVFSLIAWASMGAQTKPASAAGYTIAGTVVNAASGEPVRRATVSVQDNESREIVASVETDGEGRFSMEGLPAAKYPLTASKRGFLTGFYDEHEGGFSTAIVTGADQQTSGLVFRLTPGASLYGVVTGDGDDAVEGARVMLFRKPHGHNPGDKIRSAGQTNTDDTGAYEFDGLAPGEYLVAVKAEPWFNIIGPASDEGTALDVAYPVTYFDSTTDQESATSITLTGGDHVDANIILRTVPALHLVVESPMKENKWASLVEMHQTIFDTELSIEDVLPPGNRNTVEVKLPGIAPGHYELTQGDPPRVAEIDVTSSQRIDPNLGTPAMALKGSLQSADGSTLPESMVVRLVSFDETQNHAPLQTGVSGGKFSFDAVPPGSWELWVFADGKDPILTSLTIGGRTFAGNHFTMREKPIQVVATVSLSETRVEGFAHSKDDKGQSGAMIVLVPKERATFRALVRRDQSDSDGSFSLHDVAPGEYTVVAIEEGWDLDWQRPEVIGRYLSGGIPVTVTAASGKLLRLSGPVPVQKP